MTDGVFYIEAVSTAFYLLRYEVMQVHLYDPYIKQKAWGNIIEEIILQNSTKYTAPSQVPFLISIFHLKQFAITGVNGDLYL